VVIIAVAIWIRLKLKESPEFAKLEKKHQVTERPLANLLSNSMRNVLLGSACAWVAAVPGSTRPWR
jgi:MHS family metabolite:H+ symporter-like MFS transporter